MPDKIRDIKEGDIVEIALTPDARRYTEAYYFFHPDADEETNIPGRTHVGYVSKLEEDSIWLAQDWNKLNGKTNMGAVRYYLKVVESWRKL